MAFARINDTVLHYRLSGLSDAPILTLANALGTDARIWDDMIDRLADRYRIVSYDKRGHGLSSDPSGDCTIDDHVDDLVGLLNHLGIEKLALAGVSIGGMIAQRFAVRHPDRLIALVLCDTAAKIGDADMWNGRIEAVTKNGLAAIAEMVMARWFSQAYRSSHPAELSGWRTMFERMPAQGYIGTCAALRDADLHGEIGAISTPTLVLVGDQDLSTPPELVRQTADKMPNARFELIAGAGHIPSIEQPVALAATMALFLDEVGHG